MKGVMEIVELRCPVGPKQLLGKMLHDKEQARIDRDSNLMELACRDCGRALRKDDPHVLRVVHRFNILGELIESVVQHRDD